MVRTVIYIVLIVVLLVLGTSCDNRDPNQTSYYVTLAASSDTLQVEEENNDIELVAHVMDNQGQDVKNVSVSFATNFGSVLGNGITDEYGNAYSTFWYDGTVTGAAEIRARYQGSEAMVTVLVVDNNPYVLDIWALQDTFILGSNVQNTEIWASLTDRMGNVLSDRTIMFSTESGYVTPTTNTNESGYASAVFIHNAEEPATIGITATYLTATAVTYVYVIEPEIVNLSIWAEHDTVYAGTNSNTSIIYAQLTDQYAEPLVEKRIDFSATSGSILPWDNTDEYGIAQQEFYYTERDEYSTVTASYNGILANLIITIKPFSYEIGSVFADTLEIVADNDILTFATISVQIVGSLGVPVSGKQVQFVPSLGYMSESMVVTDEDGLAVSMLHDTGMPGTSHIDIYCEPDQSFIQIEIVSDDDNRRINLESN